LHIEAELNVGADLEVLNPPSPVSSIFENHLLPTTVIKWSPKPNNGINSVSGI
jgi:hypothetical protein